MRYSEGGVGRVFVLSLDDGDELPAAIEDFAADKGVSRGMCMLVGGIDDGGNIVVGPRDRETMPPEPMLHKLGGVHEVAAVGTLFPGEDGRPRLHMHAALGREGKTHTGCIRPGVSVWKLGEVILLEILGANAGRRFDPATGFEMLQAEIGD
jgi:predicted DNA-binding protein with PD1-like motif